MFQSLVAIRAFRVLTVASLVAGLVNGHSPTRRWGEHEMHEKRTGEPIAWQKQSRAAGYHALQLRIGLKQRNLEHADRFLHATSDPDSPSYAKHWTADQVAKTFAPDEKTIEQSIEWLVSHGIAHDRIGFSKGRNWMVVNTTVEEAEPLLNTEYYYFLGKDGAEGGLRIACDSYSLPAKLKQHIDFVMPTVHLDGLQPIAKRTSALTRRETDLYEGLTGTKYCDELITIECLRAIYNFGQGNYSAASNKMGIVEYANYLSDSDLATFFKMFTNPEIPPDTVPEFVSIDGGKRLEEVPAPKSFESNLDFQAAYSIIWPQQLRLYQVGDGVNVDGVGTFNIFLDALDASYCTYMGGDQPYIDPQYPDPSEGGYMGPLQCGGAPQSNVISVSYGQIEAALPEFYQRRQCYEWMKLGLQGISIILSSGDTGVASNYNSGYNDTCVNAEFGYVDTNGTRFSPGFPMNCPYVTSVGATTLKSDSIYGGEEAVALNVPPAVPFYSGGGFSNVFERPAYQDGPVTHYLSNYAPDYGPNVYNRRGRGFPDVSALGLNIAVVYRNTTSRGAGTSASAPIFASIISLINEERIRVGKRPIGFLNPTIYKHPEMFNDVSLGANPGCNTEGFAAVKGWDPVTGMGTPNYEKMKAVFMRLP